LGVKKKIREKDFVRLRTSCFANDTAENGELVTLLTAEKEFHFSVVIIDFFAMCDNSDSSKFVEVKGTIVLLGVRDISCEADEKLLEIDAITKIAR